MRAIVLNSTRYADDSFIVNLYTDENGPTTVSVKTGRKSKVRQCHIQPLTLLQITLSGKPTNDIKQIHECSSIASIALSGNPIKMLTAQYLAELLGKILRNHPDDIDLFEFLHRSISKLNTLTRGEANFHLFFLIKLTKYLGINPNLEDWTGGTLFDLTDGRFVKETPTHGYCLTESDSINFTNMLRTGYDSMYLWEMSRAERNNTLNHIIDYYRLHLIDISNLRSMDVLRSI